jgi:hypothetical protein
VRAVGEQGQRIEHDAADDLDREEGSVRRQSKEEGAPSRPDDELSRLLALYSRGLASEHRFDVTAELFLERKPAIGPNEDVSGSDNPDAHAVHVP